MEKITVQCKCIMIGRKPKQQEKEKYKCAIVSFFDENRPHKRGITPKKVMDFPNMEKVRIKNLNVTYYLEGNDLVINDLYEVTLEVDKQKNKIEIRGRQDIIQEPK